MGVGRDAATEAAYDAIARDYDRRTRRRSADADDFVERFVQALRSGSRVLDLGCGPGHDLRRLASAGHRPVGLDRSVELLTLAGDGQRVRGDLTRLPFRPGSVEAIWSQASLLHVDQAALNSTFAEWERVVCPGGVVGLSTSLGGDSGWELVPAPRARVPETPGGMRRWFVHHDKEELVETMDRRGWDFIELSLRSSLRSWLQVIARTPFEPQATPNATSRS